MPMFVPYFSGFWKTNYLSKLRSVNSIHKRSHSWDMCWQEGRWRLTPLRSKQQQNGQNPLRANNCRASWGSNFYRRFVWNYSQVAFPLTRLTSTKCPFTWSPEADAAFKKLKHLFATAPILIQIDPNKQFIVAVDASDIGVGEVLSQTAGPSLKLQPCAYFSRRLTPAKRNYDVGDRELLAVKLALEEWRHLLEGTEQPFVVWTDHKNLTYLRNAKT